MMVILRLSFHHISKFNSSNNIKFSKVHHRFPRKASNFQATGEPPLTYNSLAGLAGSNDIIGRLLAADQRIASRPQDTSGSRQHSTKIGFFYSINSGLAWLAHLTPKMHS